MSYIQSPATHAARPTFNEFAAACGILEKLNTPGKDVADLSMEGYLRTFATPLTTNRRVLILVLPQFAIYAPRIVKNLWETTIFWIGICVSRITALIEDNLPPACCRRCALAKQDQFGMPDGKPLSREGAPLSDNTRRPTGCHSHPATNSGS